MEHLKINFLTYTLYFYSIKDIKKYIKNNIHYFLYHKIDDIEIINIITNKFEDIVSVYLLNLELKEENKIKDIIQKDKDQIKENFKKIKWFFIW